MYFRACNITVILERKPALQRLTVVLVDEDLGLGWEKDWSEERINDIRNRYEKFDKPYSSAFASFKNAHIDHS